MSTDQIFIVTIQNMVNSYVSTDREPATVKSQWNWQKKDANKELLTNVKSLLEKVSNCETAMACAKWMVTQLPSGKLSSHSTVYLYTFLEIYAG